MPMWYIYIIRCSDSTLYTGITRDIVRRLAEHNRGKGGRFTQFRNPVKLLYRREVETRSEALKGEAEIKKLRREEKLKLIRSFGLSH